LGTSPPMCWSRVEQEKNAQFGENPGGKVTPPDSFSLGKSRRIAGGFQRQKETKGVRRVDSIQGRVLFGG